MYTTENFIHIPFIVMNKWYLIAKPLLKKRGGGYKGLADRLHVQTATVGHYMTGRRNPTPEQLREIADYLGVSMATLFGEVGEAKEITPKTHDGGRGDQNVSGGPKIGGTVPLISFTQAGDYVEVIDNLQPGQGERIDTSAPVKRYTFALRVEGDSMADEFKEGTIIIVEPEMEAVPGHFVVVRTTDNLTTFKQLVQDGGDWYLKPLNDRYPIKPLPKDAVIVGVVREQVKRYC